MSAPERYAVRMKEYILKRIVLLVVLTVLLFARTYSDAFAKSKDIDSKQIESVIAAIKPTIVRVRVTMASYEEGREVKIEGSGSGVIISEDGYVVTNHHVAGRAKHLLCNLSNKEEIVADLVGTDALNDIAVIKLRGKPGRKFPYAKWGDSSKLNVGDRVMALGSPLSLSQSVTLGIVSNTEMILPEFLDGLLTLDGENTGSNVRWIGHDAAIFGGNSGGPLMNLDGEVVGINEVSLGSLGGAIPSSQARQVAEELIRHGKVTRSWIGAVTQPLLKNTGNEQGVLVSGIMPGSPADKAGLKSGDILIRLAGKDVFVQPDCFRSTCW